MKICDGKLYDYDGRIVKPQFGNPDQIQIIRGCENRFNSLKEGVSITPKFEAYFDEEFEDETMGYSAKVKFQCVCGERINTSYYTDDNDPLELVDESYMCWNCKNEYEIIKSDNGISIKLII